MSPREPVTERVTVDGLRDLQRDLRAIDRNLPKELRRANLEAAKVVADATRESFASRGGVAPKVAPSVKALAQQRSASVKIGGARYPYALGSEFGGGKYGAGNPTSRGGHTTQFPPYKKGGYSLFPSIKETSEEVLRVHAEAVDRLVAKAFPNRT